MNFNVHLDVCIDAPECVSYGIHSVAWEKTTFHLFFPFSFVWTLFPSVQNALIIVSGDQIL